MPLRALAAALALALLASPAPASARRRHRRAPASTVVLDGTPTAVRWVDGDTFRILDGPHRDRSARLDGYNTLESYGPVHRFAGWDPRDLLANAKAATRAAAAGAWACALRGREDAYGRLLVACPDVAAALVGDGLAMVYAIDHPADPGLLALQAGAQRRRAGMWARGVPAGVVTSVHSAAERPDGAAYDRVVDTGTGAALKRPHGRVYGICEEVCARTGEDVACMTYVPFERRFRHRPWCLR
ncbi:MAG TPA: thermonuclease family protein [Anaeromyxobacteraceae bacterium]|nr:thermonuclease family protein [Anaeromyxobacteraceae bacterium]